MASITATKLLAEPRDAVLNLTLNLFDNLNAIENDLARRQATSTDHWRMMRKFIHAAIGVHKSNKPFNSARHCA